jgi:hypothetical protein
MENFIKSQEGKRTLFAALETLNNSFLFAVVFTGLPVKTSTLKGQFPFLMFSDTHDPFP